MGQDIIDILIIGGGAAGYFGAIACAERNPKARIVLLEKTQKPLAKVRISGGGRCNTTHHCFEPSSLIEKYPRGSKFLRGLFYRFQPRDTIDWFADRGVDLKVESDGRMFPTTNTSQTIIDCFQREISRCGVAVHLGVDVTCIERVLSPKESYFTITTSDGEVMHSRRILVATGSNTKAHAFLKGLGHTIVPTLPSLFTFHIEDERIANLAGVSVKEVSIQCGSYKEKGPILITHWGLSGPAILRLSAWAARELHEKNYHEQLKINWIPSRKQEELRSVFLKAKRLTPGRRISCDILDPLPRQLWERFLQFSGIDLEMRYASLSHALLQKLCEILMGSILQIRGKSLNKEEFVTCGGISLGEIHTQTMESSLCPGLYFAGEVLDIDGITGGFNFQAAWTTAWIAAQSINLSSKSNAKTRRR